MLSLVRTRSTVPFVGALLLAAGLVVVLMSMSPEPRALADGTDSPDACTDMAGNTSKDDDANYQGPESVTSLTIQAPEGDVITAICIKDGNDTFEDPPDCSEADDSPCQHSDVITEDGTYGIGGCYTVAGMGTDEVSVFNTPGADLDGQPCHDISHVDYTTEECEEDCGGDPQSSVDVTKTADTTWTVECEWTIDKTGPETVRVPDGGSATIEYNVNVDVDCEETINVSGTIIVTNTGETTVHVNTVTDDLGGDLDCEPTLEADLDPTESIECEYSIDLDSADDTTNVASANWDDPEEVNHDTDSDAVDVDFPDDPETTNGCVSVEDDTTGDTLDQELCYDEVPDGGADYEVEIEVDQSDCGQVTNEASVVNEEGEVLDDDSATTNVVCLGRTMGFWGNKNGDARILANGGYAANAVALGRGSNIDTPAEADKVLPTNPNACGKGSPIIFAVGAQTGSANCTLATGININSLNTAAAQTLALGYNILMVPGYSGQTIGALGCTPVGSLLASSTVNEVFTAAVALINGSASGGTTTQSQLGAINTLLGCLNQES